MEEKEIKFLLKKYRDLSALPEVEIQLIEKARSLASKAYSPYSKFSVGAALLLENDEIIGGNNQENVSFPVGACAEQVTLNYANANWPEVAVKAIAVSAIRPSGHQAGTVRPCGLCRQVLVEVENRFSSPIKVIMDGQAGIEVVEQANFLLPLSFDLSEE